MASREHLNLRPPQFKSGQADNFVRSGRTISAALSPSSNSVAAFVTNTSTVNDWNERSEQPVYFASLYDTPSSERRLFITDTSIIFAAFQAFVKDKSGDRDWARSGEITRIFRKLCLDYVNHAKECWVHASQCGDLPLQFDSDHYRSLYTSFSLFMVLHLPDPAFEQTPVGDDLMEWLNIHFIEPSTQEGDQLSALDRPWEDESFWPYLTRATIRGLVKAAVFFLDVLTRHPSQFLQPFAKQLIPLVNFQPRIQLYTSEKDFVYASRRWNDKVRAIRVAMEHVPEAERTDGFENWWERLSDIVGVLEGRGDVIQRVCEDLGGDWKEAVAAWCIFVKPRLRRDGLPEVVGPILDAMPPDPTDMEDMIHAALLTGQPKKALIHAAQLDCWLAAHLADMMLPLGLLDGELYEQRGSSTRDQYVLNYAEYLHSDPALWQLTVTYMCSCGQIGKETADEVLLRVPLRLLDESASASESRVDSQVRAGEIVGVLKAVNECCLEFERERVRRTVCRISAQTFTEEKEYGLALAYHTSAENWPGLGRVIDRVLNEYFLSGPEKFIHYVDGVAPWLPTLRTNPGTPGTFIRRLDFAVRYARFHKHRLDQQLQDAAWDLCEMFQEDVAPKSWWGVLLSDSVEYLQCGSAMLFTTVAACELFKRLEEVSIRASQGAGEDYLSLLSRTIKGSEKESLHRLMTVRFALARYLARCTMVGVGGKPSPEHRSNV